MTQVPHPLPDCGRWRKDSKRTLTYKLTEGKGDPRKCRLIQKKVKRKKRTHERNRK